MKATYLWAKIGGEISENDNLIEIKNENTWIPNTFFLSLMLPLQIQLNWSLNKLTEKIKYHYYFLAK